MYYSIVYLAGCFPISFATVCSSGETKLFVPFSFLFFFFFLFFFSFISFLSSFSAVSFVRGWMRRFVSCTTTTTTTTITTTTTAAVLLLLLLLLLIHLPPSLYFCPHSVAVPASSADLVTDSHSSADRTSVGIERLCWVGCGACRRPQKLLLCWCILWLVADCTLGRTDMYAGNPPRCCGILRLMALFQWPSDNA